MRHVEPLAEQQAAGARDVEQAARRAEEALDAELEALLRSLSEVVASDTQPPPPGVFGGQLYPHLPGADAAGYMGMGHMHMALAMDKLATLGTFLRQVSDHLSLLISFPFLSSSDMWILLGVAGGRAADAGAAGAPADPDGEAGGALLRRRRRLLLPPPRAQHALDHQPGGAAAAGERPRRVGIEPVERRHGWHTAR